MPNAFVLERKHRGPKQFANPTKILDRHFETSVLRETTAHHGRPRAIQPGVPKGRAAAAMANFLLPIKHVARKVRINEWEVVAVSDVVLVEVDPEY